MDGLEAARRTGTSVEDRHAAFAVLVRDVFDIPGRDRVVVGGIVERGELPPAGTEVVFSADGREPVTAVIAGGAAFDVRLPRISFLVAGVTARDISTNSRLTTLAPAEIIS